MDTQKIELRLEKLERHNRWLAISLAIAVILGAIALYGIVFALRVGELPFKLLETESLHLVDKNDNIRVSLLQNQGGAEFAFYDDTGRVSTSLGQFKDGSTLTFKDENNITRTSLWQVKDIHHLKLYDMKGEVIWAAP